VLLTLALALVLALLLGAPSSLIELRLPLLLLLLLLLIEPPVCSCALVSPSSWCAAMSCRHCSWYPARPPVLS
jgi:hypothetical protein